LKYELFLAVYDEKLSNPNPFGFLNYVLTKILIFAVYSYRYI
jgi:succinate-acetate transporter protein